jgi:tRNA(fMet)-specific endonuclease VapC
MIYMLGTNILIYLIKNKPPSIAAHINALDKDAALCMSFVTYAELLKGAERSTRKAQVLNQLKSAHPDHSGSIRYQPSLV